MQGSFDARLAEQNACADGFNLGPTNAGLSIRETIQGVIDCYAMRADLRAVVVNDGVVGEVRVRSD
jgi:hypothetical protein